MRKESSPPPQEQIFQSKVEKLVRHICRRKIIARLYTEGLGGKFATLGQHRISSYYI